MSKEVVQRELFHERQRDPAAKNMAGWVQCHAAEIQDSMENFI